MTNCFKISITRVHSLHCITAYYSSALD